MKYQHIVRAILSRPWAIDPESLAWAAICDVLALRASGETLSDQEIDARISAATNGPRSGSRTDRNVAVIPIYGVLSPRADMMARTSGGGTTAEEVLSAFRASMSNPEIDGVVFDVDSPGGVVEGIDELAAEIRAARGQKPIAAVANHMAASAAYWAVAGVDELVATPSATVGSIGIFTAHQDLSAAMEQKGIKTTLISAGKYKVEGNQFEPLADETRVDIQATVDSWYDTMVHSIAKGRGVAVDVVRDTYGEGRTLRAKRALERGMVDRIDSLDNTIRRVARGTVGRSGRTAALTPGIRVASLAAGDETEDRDGAGAATSFAARAEAAAAEVVAIGELARKRAELRAEEGRAPSPADGLALSLLAGSLAELPGAEVEETETVTTTTETTETVEEDASTTEAPATPEGRRKRVDLELLEAATRGGYSLPV